jgi:cysteine-rich repeat protein
LVDGDGCSSLCDVEYWWECFGEPSVCNRLCNLTSAYWDQTNVLEGTPVRLYTDGTNCYNKEISLEIMEDDDGFLNRDDHIEYLNFIYGSPNTYANWIAEWTDDTDLGQENPPEYYFIATALSTGQELDSNILTVEQLLQCIGKNYCADYKNEGECNSDLCSIGNGSVPQDIACGINFNPITGCSDSITCGCYWNESGTPKCNPYWDTNSSCGSGVCGDSIVNNGEQCDLGTRNGISGSGCSANCNYERIPPPCPEGLTLCEDGNCSLNCYITNVGPAICDNDGVCEANEGCTCEDCDEEQDECEAGLICSLIDQACCNEISDDYCNPYCSSDPDCTIIGDAFIGTCTYTESGSDNCDESGGMIFRNLTHRWEWSPYNLQYYLDNGKYFDPLGKYSRCVDLQDVLTCVASAQVNFFKLAQFVIVIILVALIYLLYRARKKHKKQKRYNLHHHSHK